MREFEPLEPIGIESDDIVAQAVQRQEEERQQHIDQQPPLDLEPDEPQRQRRTRSDAGKPRGKRGPRKPKAAKLADEIRPDLEQTLGLLSLALTPISPTGAEFNERHVDQNVRVVANLCIRHPRLLEYIRQAGGLTAYFELFQFGFGLALCVMVDLNRVNPDAMLTRILGVSDAYHTVYEEGVTQNGSKGEGPADISPPSFLARVAAENQE